MTIQSRESKLWRASVIETSAVLTIVVSIVERNSAIQSLILAVSLSTIDSPGLEVMIPKRQHMQSPPLNICRTWLHIFSLN